MSYILKTAPPPAISGERITISERAYYSGDTIAAGDEAFVWFSETNGGHGLSWRGVVDDVDSGQDGQPRVTIRLIAQIQGEGFGTAQVEPFCHVNDGSPIAGLAKKLYGHSHHKIAELTGEEAAVLRNQFD
jgi:hypothetical protein